MPIGKITALQILALPLVTTLGCANLVALLPPVEGLQPPPTTASETAVSEEVLETAKTDETAPLSPTPESPPVPTTMDDAIQHMKRLSVADNFAKLPPLLPGEFDWQPDKSRQGPVLVIVNLPYQMAYVYRDDVLIGRSTISTGRPGYETPTGVFPILQKRVEHYSNLYDNAEMPYMTRLTWDGIAMHGGELPGYPASHGCVRLPLEFSQQLYQITQLGTPVVVTDMAANPEQKVVPVSAESSDINSEEAPSDAESGTAI
jgi:lipoprotein-anchoring transpeptidase ErfK/SrfK